MNRLGSFTFLFLSLVLCGVTYAESPVNRFDEIESRLRTYFDVGAAPGVGSRRAFEAWAWKQKGRDVVLLSELKDENFRKAFAGYDVVIERRDGWVTYQVRENTRVDGSVRTVILSFEIRGQVIGQVRVMRSID